MKDYLEYRTARMKKAWGGRISPSAVESSVKARFLRMVFLILLALALIALVVQIALHGVTIPLVLLTCITLIAGFFQGRSYEHSGRAAQEVLSQYDLPQSAKGHFRSLDLETFDQKLASARDEAPWEERETLVLEDPPVVKMSKAPVESKSVAPAKKAVAKKPARRPAAKKTSVPKVGE